MEIAPGCIFDHVKISPDRQIPEHTQETLEISLVLRGSGKFCAGKAARPFSPGELFLIPSGIPGYPTSGSSGKTTQGLQGKSRISP